MAFEEGSRSFRPVGLVPAYFCESTVEGVVAGLSRCLSGVLVVDDGSGDATAERAARAGARVLRRPVNGGKGTAVRDGLELLLGETWTHVVFVDADGQHDPLDVPRLLESAREGADFVIGSRLQARGEMPARSFWANTIGNKVLSRMTGLEVEDAQSGLRVISAKLLMPLRLTATRYSIENEILIKASRRVERLSIVPVRSIYAGERRHYRPFRDTWITSWLSAHYKTTGSDES